MHYLPQRLVRLSLSVAVPLLFSTGAWAHTAFLFLAIEDDGQLRIETGFSDGGTGGGLPVEIRDAESGELLETVTMPESGIAQAARPSRAYTVTLNAGEGHRVSKPGPMPKAADAPTKPLLLNCQWGNAAALDDATRQALQRAKVVVAHEWLFDRLRPLFTDQTVVLVDADVLLTGQSSDDAGRKAADLRSRVRQRMQQALDAGLPVVVLCATGDAPDWLWLIEEELATSLEASR